MIDYKDRARLATMIIIRLSEEFDDSGRMPNGNRAVRAGKFASRYLKLSGITKDTPLLSEEDLRLARGEDK